MRITISGRNVDLGDRLKNQVNKKLGKLEKYFAPDTEARVVLSRRKDAEIIEVTIPTRNGFIRAEEATDDFFASIDLAEETIERQIKKYKTKLTDKKQSALAFSDLFLDDRSFGGLPDWGTIYHRIQAGKALDGEWHRLGLYEEEEEKRGFFSRLFSRD